MGGRSSGWVKAGKASNLNQNGNSHRLPATDANTSMTHPSTGASLRTETSTSTRTSTSTSTSASAKTSTSTRMSHTGIRIGRRQAVAVAILV